MRVETQEYLNDAAKNLNTTNSKTTLLNSMAAILYKDAINSRRHGVILAFQTIFPLITIILFESCGIDVLLYLITGECFNLYVVNSLINWIYFIFLF